MPHWQYKTLWYSIQGKVFYSLRFWADHAGRVYGPRERARWVGGLASQLRQLEEALKELDQEGWELVATSIWMSFPGTRHGCAVVRQAPAPELAGPTGAG